MSRHWSNVEAMVPFWTVASSMFSFVFQSLISSVGDEEVIQSSDTKEVIQSSDAKEVIQSSDAKVMDGVDNSQQENQVLGDLLHVTGPMLRHWSNTQALVKCQGIGPMSRHWSNVEALVQCRGIGLMSRQWSNVEAMVSCRGIGPLSRHWSHVEALVQQGARSSLNFKEFLKSP